MATASFGALQLIEEQELELDLGDGASHLMPPHVSPSSGSIEAHRSSLPHQHQRHFSGPPPPPYVYHRAGTALPRFIWNLYTICGSEQRGNYWFPFASSPPLVSCSFHRRHPTRCTLLYSPLCNVYRSNLVIAGTNLLQTRIIVCTFLFKEVESTWFLSAFVILANLRVIHRECREEGRKEEVREAMLVEHDANTWWTSLASKRTERFSLYNISVDVSRSTTKCNRVDGTRKKKHRKQKGNAIVIYTYKICNRDKCICGCTYVCCVCCARAYVCVCMCGNSAKV